MFNFGELKIDALSSSLIPLKLGQTLETDKKIYIFLRSILRIILQLFNLGLVKKHDLNRLHEIQISYQCLVGKLAFFWSYEILNKKI
jgi:hypothetical protein